MLCRKSKSKPLYLGRSIQTKITKQEQPRAAVSGLSLDDVKQVVAVALAERFPRAERPAAQSIGSQIL